MFTLVFKGRVDPLQIKIIDGDVEFACTGVGMKGKQGM